MEITIEETESSVNHDTETSNPRKRIRLTGYKQGEITSIMLATPEIEPVHVVGASLCHLDAGSCITIITHRP